MSLELGLLNPPINYKSTTGWVSLNLEALHGIARETAEFVQTCFNREKAVGVLIDNGTMTNQDQIDGAFS